MSTLYSSRKATRSTYCVLDKCTGIANRQPYSLKTWSSMLMSCNNNKLCKWNVEVSRSQWANAILNLHEELHVSFAAIWTVLVVSLEVNKMLPVEMDFLKLKSNVCTVTACFLQSSQDSSLQSQVLLTILSCLRSDTCHYGHINRCSYLLTVKLHTSIICRNGTCFKFLKPILLIINY